MPHCLVDVTAENESSSYSDGTHMALQKTLKGLATALLFRDEDLACLLLSLCTDNYAGDLRTMMLHSLGYRLALFPKNNTVLGNPEAKQADRPCKPLNP